MTLDHAATLIDLDRAEEALEAIASSGDQAGTARGECLRALALMRLKRFSEAEQAAGRARSQAPHWEWGYRLGAIAVLRQRRFDQARMLAEQAVAVAPHEPLTHQVMAITLLNLKQLPAAMVHTSEMIRLAPDLALSWETQGRVLLAQASYAEAAESLAYALRLDPQDADCMSLMAIAQDHLGNGTAARDLRLSALRTDPQNVHRQKDLLRRGGTVAAGSALTLGKLGFFGKFVVIEGAIHGGSLLQSAAGLAFLAVVLVAYVVGFVVSRRRRSRLGRELPANVWEGLAPHRRNADLTWIAWPFGFLGLVGGTWTVVDAVKGQLAPGPVLAFVLGLCGLTACWQLRAGRARDLTLRDAWRDQVRPQLRFRSPRLRRSTRA